MQAFTEDRIRQAEDLAKTLHGVLVSSAGPPLLQRHRPLCAPPRGVPDVALTASSGHDPYVIVSGGQWGWVGGTSAAAPSFAAIVVLLNQYWRTNGLGNINPNLYALSQSVPGLFHDVTTGNNVVPCQVGSSDCPNGSLGYAAGPGYDQVTGIGSVDAAHLVANWTALPFVAITALRSDTTVVAGGKVNITITVTNKGGAAAGPFRIGEYLSTSPTTLSDVVPLGNCDFPGLAAGASTTCSGPVSNSLDRTARSLLPDRSRRYAQPACRVLSSA
jgi:hypothetical protein